MLSCTFFGHRDCPETIKPKLHGVLVELIEKHSVDMFYVGNNGAFDRMVRTVLRELSEKYTQIRYAVVLERIPVKKNGEDYSDAILRKGLRKRCRALRFRIATNGCCANQNMS